MTKLVLITFLFTGFALAQNPSSACGPQNISFNVTLNKSPGQLPRPEPRKAMVVFIQDFGLQQFGLGVHPIARIGVDGTWVGAIKDNSYIYVSLNQGVHHICVNVDSKMLENPVEFAHVRVESGAVYYLRWRYMQGGDLLLGPVDSDEAKYQIGIFPLSVPTPKN